MRTFKQHLTELSKKTLGNYVKKAAEDRNYNGYKEGRAHGRNDVRGIIDPVNRDTKRKIGISKATDKLTKEEKDGVNGPAMSSNPPCKNLHGSDSWNKREPYDAGHPKIKKVKAFKDAAATGNPRHFAREEVEQVDESLKAVVTKRNSDGSYDNVGMNNRRVLNGSEGHIRKQAMDYAKGPHRIEFHHSDAFYRDPHKTIHVNEENEIDEAYSKSAVDKEIRKDKRIGGREAKAIHRLLKGRQVADEPVTVTPGQPQPWHKKSVKEETVVEAKKKPRIYNDGTDSDGGIWGDKKFKVMHEKPLKKKSEPSKPVKEETLVEEHEMSDAAHELVLHADNDSHLHHGSHMPIIHNLKKKMKKGNYDPEKAKKLWGYHADRAAQSYHKQYGDKSQPWHKMFTTHDRKQAASHWEAHHRDELKD